MNNVIKRRDSNFELLRIVSMIFIILHHFVINSSYKISETLNIRDFIFTSFWSCGKLGVILFVMITGYYMVKSKKIKVSKLILLEGQVLFYSIGIYGLFMLLGNKEFVIGDFLRSILPNLMKSYWFFSSYFILYLCIPFLNKLVNNISKKEFERLLIIGFIILILIPSVILYSSYISEGIYLFYYYLVGAYIRLYKDKLSGGVKYLVISLVSYLVIVFVSLFLGSASYSNELLLGYIYSYSNLDSILVFVCGVSLFMFFKGLKLGSNKLINLGASTAFSVYIIHEHIFMRELLWDKLFNLTNFSSNILFLVGGIGIAILIYLLCGLIDLLRQYLFKYLKKMVIKFGWKKNLIDF